MQVESGIIVYAFRYALGRQTYAVSDVCQCIVQNSRKMNIHDLQLIKKEIKEALEDEEAGPMDLTNQWEQVYYHIDTLLKGFKK